jgi:hypothetical protein
MANIQALLDISSVSVRELQVACKKVSVFPDKSFDKLQAFRFALYKIQEYSFVKYIDEIE